MAVVGPPNEVLEELIEEPVMVPVVIVVELPGMMTVPAWYSPALPIKTASAPISAASARAPSATACQRAAGAPLTKIWPTTLKDLFGGPGNSSTCSIGLAGNVTYR